MPYRIRAFAAFLALTGAFCALMAWSTRNALSQEAWPVADMNRAIDQTNFLVNEGCSGTLIDLKERYVLTAHHCIADQYKTVEREEVDGDGEITKKKIRVLREGTVSQFQHLGADSVVTVTYKTKLAFLDKDRDLAMVQILAQVPNTQASPLACRPPGRGERIYTVGNPMGVLYSSVVTGIVSSVQRTYALLGLPDEGDGGKQPLMQISGGVIGGNSGGSNYNSAGELVGVPVRANRMNETLGFSVPLDEIKEFLKSSKLERLYDRCTK